MSPSGPPISTPPWPTPRRRSTSTPRSPPSAPDAILAAIEAGKHIFTEKPIAESVLDGPEAGRPPRSRPAPSPASCTTSSTCPGLVKLKRLVDLGFFGRILSVRGEFGYWVFEGDVIPAQRPSWNYRAEDGGGMVLDMFCHWNYVLENLFGPVEAVMRQGRHPHPRALGRAGQVLRRHRRRRGVRHLRARGRHHRPDQLLLGRARRPRRAGRVPGRRHPRLGGRRPVRLPHPAARPDAQAGLEPRPAHRPGLPGAVGRGARHRGVPERVPRAVGAVPARRGRRPSARLRPRRRRPRTAAGRGRAAVLGGRPPRRDRGLQA